MKERNDLIKRYIVHLKTDDKLKEIVKKIFISNNSNLTANILKFFDFNKKTIYRFEHFQYNIKLLCEILEFNYDELFEIKPKFSGKLKNNLVRSHTKFPLYAFNQDFTILYRKKVKKIISFDPYYKYFIELTFFLNKLKEQKASFKQGNTYIYDYSLIFRNALEVLGEYKNKNKSFSLPDIEKIDELLKFDFSSVKISKKSGNEIIKKFVNKINSLLPKFFIEEQSSSKYKKRIKFNIAFDQLEKSNDKKHYLIKTKQKDVYGDSTIDFFCTFSTSEEIDNFTTIKETDIPKEYCEYAKFENIFSYHSSIRQRLAVKNSLQRSYIFSFIDRSTINLNLFYRIFKYTSKSSKFLTIKNLLIISSLTGLLWDRVIKIVKNEDENIELDFNYRFYKYIIGYDFWKRDKEAPEDFIWGYNHTTKVIIFLPSFLRKNFQFLKSNLANFHIFEKDITEFIRNEIGYSYIYKITPIRIANFLFCYLSDRFELDPIYASLISANFNQSVVTQLHYTKVSLNKISENYVRSLNLLFNNLGLKNIDLETDPQLNEQFKKTCIGSKIVPSRKFLKQFFKKFKNFINDIETNNFHNFFRKFNYLHMYSYFLLQATTGHRPINLPLYNFRNLSLESIPFIIVKDKESKKYIEKRFIPLNSFLKAQLSELLINFYKFIKINKLRVTKGIDIKKDLYKEPYFFIMLNCKGKEILYTKENINKKLERIEPLIKFLPENFLRHFFRSFLFENNYNKNIIDTLMGHTRFGGEMFNKCSTIDLTKFLNITTEIQGKILKKLEIDEILKMNFND